MAVNTRNTENNRRNNALVYYGVKGQHALQPEIVREPERQKRVRVKVKTKHAPGAKSKLKAIAGVIIVMLMLCVIVQRYVVISVNNIEIQKAASQLKANEKEEAYLDIELAKLGDMAVVGQVAQDELNMGYPTADQTVYINCDTANDEEKDTKEEGTTENNLFDRVCDWVYDLGRRISS